MRALLYVPDIIKLQKMMLDKYDRKLSHEEALTLRVGSFLESIEDCKLVCCYVTVLYLYRRCTCTDEERRTFENLIENFNKAWLLVRQFVLIHG